MDSYDDFAPSPKSSSKLASIFGQDKGQQSNTSLTYTAPKQPKKESSPKQAVATESSTKLELIIAKTVFAYKLVNSAYQTLGKMGLTIVGCASPAIYQLLMYKTKEDVHCRLKITINTAFSLLEDNYASFYADTQNYSVKFENAEDIRAFAKKFIQAKSFSSPLQSIISQDIKFGTGDTVVKGSTVTLKTTGHQLSDDQSEVLVASDVVEVNIGSENSYSWIAALGEMKHGGEKLLIIPKILSDPWSDKLSVGTNLALYIELSELLQSSAEEKYMVDSSLDSAEDSSSFKEKSALLEGAMASKSLKSGLLSRVARLGQPMLPLKGAIVADLTDSEDDSSPSPKPRIRSKPPTVTARACQPLQACQPDQRSNDSMQPVPQPLTLYQPQYQSQIIMRNDVSSFGQLATPTGSCLMSPSDPSLPVYFAESRTQATELRMGISKLNDKVDLVLNKMQCNSNLPTQQIAPSPILDPTGILNSIQNLVEENQRLRNQVEEQKTKIDTLNERLYNLLEFSHRSLEKNSANSAAQLNDDGEIENLKKELKDAQYSINDLNAQLNASQQNEKEHKERLTNAQHLLVDLNMFKEKSEQLEIKLTESDKKSSEDIAAQENLLSIQIKAITDENILLKKDVELLKNELELNKKNEDELRSENSENFKIKEELMESKNIIEKLKTELEECQTRLTEFYNTSTSATGNLASQLTESKLTIEHLIKSNEKEVEEVKSRLLSQIKDLTEENAKIKAKISPSDENDVKPEKNNLVKENELIEENNKLLSQIQQLTEENIQIKNNLSIDHTAKADVSRTKTLMNNLYRSIQSHFDVKEEYSGEFIKQVLASCIREMTLQYLEEHEKNASIVDPPDSCNEEKDIVSKLSEDVSKGTVYNVNSSTSNSPETANTTYDKSNTSSSYDSPEKPFSAGPKNFEDSLDIHVAKEKEATYNQIWQTSQPPPLPVFDEDEDDPW